MSVASQFTCPACQRKFNWKPELAGKTVRCKCGSKLSVPSPPQNTPASKAKAEPESSNDLSFLHEAAAAEKQAQPTSTPVFIPPPPTPNPSRPSPLASYLPAFRIRLAPKWWKRSINNWGMTLACVILGPILLVITWNIYNTSTRFDATARSTNAEIVATPTVHEEQRRNRHGITSTVKLYRTTFAFDVDGKRYTTSVEHVDEDMPEYLNLGNPEGWKGQKITILYDPAQPARADFQQKVNFKTYAFLIIAIIMTLGGFANILMILFVPPTENEHLE